MDESYFTFRGKFYKQTGGAPMGNPLSPLLSDLFMSALESGLKATGRLPRFWVRYVDDVFAILDKDGLQDTLQTLNNVHRNITFTYEQEKDGQLPFLDLKVIRTDCSVEFEIYRKPTDKKRVIPNTSNHSHRHRMASFSHMIHRMLTLPLSEEARDKERDYIYEVARLNGYQKGPIDQIISRKKRTLFKKSLTTLSRDKTPLYRIPVTFDREITDKLRPKLKNLGIDLVYSSRNNQLVSLLGSTKDPIDKLEKAGIYKVSCSHCDKVYIGQTKRSLDVRFKEHIREVGKYKGPEGSYQNFRSKVAEHICMENHEITISDAKIVKVTDPRRLDVSESLEIFSHPKENLLNGDQGNGYSWLFKLL